MNTIVKKFEDDIELNLIIDATHQFLLPTKEVAVGFGVSSDNIRVHKNNNKDELIEGKHFLTVSNSYAQKYNLDINPKVRQQTLWTKRGLVRLGFFIKSQQARRFRDWCEDLIIDKQSKTYEPKLIAIDDDTNQVSFFERYGVLNPNLEFNIEHDGEVAKAHYCSQHVFVIQNKELCKILKVAHMTLSTQKRYNCKILLENEHFLKLSKRGTVLWTRKGVEWMAFHSGNGSFGKRLFNGEYDKDFILDIQKLSR